MSAAIGAGLRYGALGLPLAFVALPLYVVLPNHYAEQFGVPLAALGGVLLAVRSLDALLDPWIGLRVDRLLSGPFSRTLRWLALAAAVLMLGLTGLFFPLPALRGELGEGEVLEKVAFSAVTDAGLLQMPGGDRRQFVVCGTEAHVCVLQTVLGLLAEDREVFVVEEAVGSRRPQDKALALERMCQAGAVIVSREMVAFEWMERAGTEVFREISRQFIR